MVSHARLRPLIWVAVAVLTAALTLAVTVAIQVDSWGRDLVTNVAETAWTAADPDLRPVVVELSASATADLVISVVSSLPRWRLIRRSIGDSTIQLHLVRSTRIFRFRDDVTVTVIDRGDHREVTARSASRFGTGDLGQNPRNLKELTRALRARLEAKAPRRRG